MDLTLARYQLHWKDSSPIKQEIKKIWVYSLRVKEGSVKGNSRL